MIKRLTWFVSGAVAGVAGVGFAKRKVKQTAAQLAPANIARSAAEKVKEKAHEVADAVRDGREAMRTREAELRATLDREPGGADADPIEAVLVDRHGDNGSLGGESPGGGGRIVVVDLRDDHSDHVGPRRTSRRRRRAGA